MFNFIDTSSWTELAKLLQAPRSNIGVFQWDETLVTGDRVRVVGSTQHLALCGPDLSHCQEVLREQLGKLVRPDVVVKSIITRPICYSFFDEGEPLLGIYCAIQGVLYRGSCQAPLGVCTLDKSTLKELGVTIAARHGEVGELHFPPQRSCECGAAKLGFKPGQAGHSPWCPVH